MSGRKTNKRGRIDPAPDLNRWIVEGNAFHTKVYVSLSPHRIGTLRPDRLEPVGSVDALHPK